MALSELHRFSGTYKVLSHDQGSSAGSLLMSPAAVYLDATRQRPDGSTRVGIAVPHSGRIVLAWGPAQQVEIGIYDVNGREMLGTWVPPQADSVGSFGREPSVSASEDGDTRHWTIQDARAIDGSGYSGRLTVRPVGTPVHGIQPVAMAWTLQDGVYDSFGLSVADAIYSTFNFQPGTEHGLVVYQPEGDTWVGVEARDASGRVSLERLARSG